jgi:hypothetical protein
MMQLSDESPRRPFEDVARTYPMSAKMRAAVQELAGLIRGAFPEAQFGLHKDPDDPSTTILVATVDVDDLEEVVDLFIDRMGELNTEEGVPILVVPLHTPEHVAATYAAMQPAPAVLPTTAR